MTVRLLLLSNSIPKTNPGITLFFGPNRDSSILFHSYGLKCYADEEPLYIFPY